MLTLPDVVCCYNPSNLDLFISISLYSGKPHTIYVTISDQPELYEEIAGNLKKLESRGYHFVPLKSPFGLEWKLEISGDGRAIVDDLKFHLAKWYEKDHFLYHTFKAELLQEFINLFTARGFTEENLLFALRCPAEFPFFVSRRYGFLPEELRVCRELLGLFRNFCTRL